MLGGTYSHIELLKLVCMFNIMCRVFATNRYTKRGSMGGVFSATELFMLTDQSEGFEVQKG